MQQRGSGHLAVPVRRSDTVPRTRCARSEDELVGKPAFWRGVCMSVLEPRRESGKAHERKPRSEPDWGKPTVRDRRGACGNVVAIGSRTEGHRETDGNATGPYGCRRAAFLSRPSSPRREIGGSWVGRITGNTGKSADGERVSEGCVVAGKRGNARGAKAPCCV